MTAIIVLWILLGIIAVIVILLHFSLTAYIDLDKNGFELKVKYMFFNIYPRKPKKKSESVSEEPDNGLDLDSFDEFDDDLEEGLEVGKPVESRDDAASEQVAVNAESHKEEQAEITETNVTSESIVESTGSADLQQKQEISVQEHDDNEQQHSENIVEVKEEKKGLHHKLFHKKDKHEKRSVKNKKKKKSKLDELKEKYAMIKPYIPMGWKYFKKLLKTIRFTDTRIVLDVGREDAYDAAMLYGKVQAGLFNGIAVLAGIFTVKLKKADVNCIFYERKFGYEVHTVVRIRPSTLIAIAFCLGVNFLRIYLWRRHKKKSAAKKRKKERLAKMKEAKTVK